MPAMTYHPEDVRAELRKRHGTVGAFASASGFKAQALADWLRGRTNAAVAQAVAAELGVAEVHLEDRESMKVDGSAPETAAHRQNAEAR